MRTFLVINNVGQSISAGAHSYMPAASGGVLGTSSETNGTVTVRSAGTFKNLWVYISANATTASSTIRSKKNGSNANLSVTIPSGTTGEFTDTTNEDSISAGDTYTIDHEAGTGGTLTHMGTALEFNSPKGAVMFYMAGRNLSVSEASTTSFFDLPTAGFVSATEANHQSKMLTDGVLRNVYVRVVTNGRSTTTTLGIRKNGANGNLSVSVPGSTTGAFEDTTNLDHFTKDDLLCWQITTGTGTGTFSFKPAVVESYSDHGKHQVVNSRGGQTVNSSTTTYFAYGGGGQASTTESNQHAQIMFDQTAKGIGCYVNSNSVSAASTLTLRRNGQNTGLNVLIPASTTGRFRNTESSARLYAGDKVAFQLVTGGSGTSMSIGDIGVMAIEGHALREEPGLRPRPFAPGFARTFNRVISF